MGILKRTKTKAKNRERNNMRKDVDVEEAFLSQKLFMTSISQYCSAL